MLGVLPHLLQHPKPSVQKEAAWLLSNVAAGPCQQIQQLITCGLLPPMVELLDKVRDGYWAAQSCCRSNAEVCEVMVPHL